MAGSMVGADADALERAAVEMRAAADELDQYAFGLTSLLGSVLWIGQFASDFLASWSGTHRVRMRSTADFIRDAAETLQRNAADQRATSSDSGGAGGGGIGSLAGAGAGAVPPGPAPGEDAIPPEDIFDEEYMEDSVDEVVPGTDDPELNDALERLLEDDLSDEEIDDLLETIAEARGVPAADLRADYDHLIAQGNEFGDFDAGGKPDYLGSTWSLRYGQIVGDALGVDPIFGVLLNPSGGLVGQGESGEAVHPDSFLGYHGAFHDAAGYLYNHQGIGPGYSYIEGDNGDPSDPLSGQLDGLNYWRGTVGMRPGDVLDGGRILGGIALGYGKDGLNWAGDRFEDGANWAEDRVEDGKNWADDRVDDVKDLWGKVT